MVRRGRRRTQRPSDIRGSLFMATERKEAENKTTPSSKQIARQQEGRDINNLIPGSELRGKDSPDKD